MAARTLDLHPGRTRLVGQILPLAAMILRSVRCTTRLLGSRHQRLATPGLLTQVDYVVAAGAGTFTMIKLVLLLPLLKLLVLVVVPVAIAAVVVTSKIEVRR